MDYTLPGSYVHGILQIRIQEWKKKKEYKSGLPLPSPGDLSDPGIQPKTPALQADSLPSELFIFHIMLKILLEDTNKNS